MFMLVFWKIDDKLMWHDKFIVGGRGGRGGQDPEKVPLIQRNTKINF